MDTLLLKVVTPHGEVFNDNVSSVRVPASEGEIGILPRHASLLSNLKPGILRIEKLDGVMESIVINWGIVKVSEFDVSVLIDDAIALNENQNSSIVDAICDAKNMLQKALPNDIMMASLEKQIESSAKDLF